MMRYPLEEKTLKKNEDSRKLNKAIGNLYLSSNTIEDFIVKADLKNFPRSKIWMLVAYYHLRQRQISIRWTIILSSIFLSMITCCTIETICRIIDHSRPISHMIGAGFCGLICGLVLGFFGILAFNWFLEFIPRKFTSMTHDIFS